MIEREKKQTRRLSANDDASLAFDLDLLPPLSPPSFYSPASNNEKKTRTHSLPPPPPPPPNKRTRSKKKAVHKASAGDDKRLQSTLKRLGVHQIPGIDEVAIYHDDGSVVHFGAPKVQASINANTFVVSGPSSIKSQDEMIPPQLQGMSPEQLQMLIQQMQAAQAAGGGGAGAGAAAVEAGAGGGDDDDDIPELVENAE